MKQLSVLCLLVVFLAHQSYGQYDCTPINCVTPACRCMSTTNPGGLSLGQTPQLVYLSFDGAITESVINNYQAIFSTARFNPNGCPFRATFFVSHQYTDYNWVNNFYTAGHEIADFTMTASYNKFEDFKQMTQTQWSQQLSNMRVAANQFGLIPTANIRGVRAPYLQSTENTVLALQGLGMQYEASFTTVNFNATTGPIWPYTLNRGLGQECNVDPCPLGSYNGIWAVPMLSLLNPNGTYNAMVDGWQSPNKADALKYLKDNFLRSYNSNKAPIGFNMNADAWFNQPDTYFRREALTDFLDYLYALSDVYVVPIGKVVDYMKNPLPLSSAGLTSGPLACPAVSTATCRRTTCTYDKGSSPIGDATMTACNTCPNSYPWLGNPTGS